MRTLLAAGVLTIIVGPSLYILIRERRPAARFEYWMRVFTRQEQRAAASATP